MTTVQDLVDLKELIKRVKTGEPVEFTMDGRQFALITKADLEIFEALEDASDVRAADEALAEMEASGEQPIPWEDVKKKYGFDE